MSYKDIMLNYSTLFTDYPIIDMIHAKDARSNNLSDIFWKKNLY